MDKLILKVHKLPKADKREVIRIDGPAYEIVMQLQRQTGLSAQFIVSEMVKFAVDKVEIKEVD